jgi:hypothetical protein
MLYLPEPAWVAGDEDHRKVWAPYQCFGCKGSAIRASWTEVEIGYQDSELVQVSIQDAKRSLGIGYIPHGEAAILKVEREQAAQSLVVLDEQHPSADVQCCVQPLPHAGISKLALG